MAHAPPTDILRPLLDRRAEARSGVLDALAELEDRTRDVLKSLLTMRTAASEGADERALQAVAAEWLRWRTDAAGPTGFQYAAARTRAAEALGRWRAACREASYPCDDCGEARAEYQYTGAGALDQYCRACLLDHADPSHLTPLLEDER